MDAMMLLNHHHHHHHHLHLLLELLLLLGSISGVYGYESGAPEGSCSSLEVVHDGLRPQPAQSPYSITLGSAVYERGEVVEVRVSQGTVKGFIVQAKRLGSVTTSPIGSWLQTIGQDKPLRCSQENDTLTHSSSYIKDDFTLKWLPPQESALDIQFIFTFVHDFHTFWIKVPSPVISPGESYNIPLPTATATAQKQTGSDKISDSDVMSGNGGDVVSGEGDASGSGSSILPWEWAMLGVLLAATLAGLTSAIIWCCCRGFCCCERRKRRRETYLSSQPSSQVSDYVVERYY